MLGPLLEVEMSKSVHRCGTKHISKSQCQKHHMLARTTFGRSDVVSLGRRKGLCALSNMSKTWGFYSMSKNDGRRGTFEEDLQRCIGAVQEICSSKVLGGQGADFLRGVAFWSIRSSGLLRWFCVTGAARRMTWHHFSWQAQYFRQMEWKIAKRIGTRPSALHSTFHFWRKSRRIALFLMLSTGKIGEVSQNCFVFDVVNFKHWGSLAGLFRFWCCPVQKLRKSCRIASFSSLQIDR